MAYAKTNLPSFALFSLLPLSAAPESTRAIAADAAWHLRSALATCAVTCRPLAIAVCCLVFVSARFALAADSPVELRHLGFAKEKSWVIHSLWMKVSNQTDKPKWLLLPWWGDKRLAEKVMFRNEGFVFDEPCNMIAFDTKEGLVAIGVSCGASFRALRLPARAVVEIPEYHIPSHMTTDFTQIVVVEADELLVNGKSRLEKWLPFEVGVFKEEMLPSGVGKKAKLEAEKAAASRKERPPEKVEYVEATGVHRWTLKFQNIGEKR
jgi:hypothetical protein